MIKNREKGFTLLEVLIAVVITGISFTILAQGYSQVVNSIDRNRDYTYISSRAEDRLIKTVNDIEVNRSGSFSYAGKRYRWRTDEERITDVLTKIIVNIEKEDGQTIYSLSRLVLRKE